MKSRTRLLTILFAVISVVIMMGAGCTAAPANSDTPPDPFTVVWGPGGEQVVTFSGDSKGHLPGEKSEFILKLENNSSTTWSGEYLIQLLDRYGIVMEIASERFEIDPGLGPEFTIPAVFESGLEGPYGLSLMITPNRGQSVTTIWVGDKLNYNVNVGPWPGIGTHPWLWESQQSNTEEAALELAWQFVRSSPTFTFDGIEGTLELKETLYPDIESCWQFVIYFESRHAGYGDRSGRMLAQVITPHEAIVTVEKGNITSAVMDGKWDMIAGQMLDIESAEESEAVEAARTFVLNSPTFAFDGIEESLTLVNTAAFAKATVSPGEGQTGETRGLEFTFEFECRHAGYGDRSGQMLAQLITPHEAVVTVVKGNITSAVMDGSWDMIAQEEIENI